MTYIPYTPNIPDPSFIPEVGKLIYYELLKNEDNSFHSAFLIFLTSPVLEGDTWRYTQIAYIEDDKGELEVTLEPELGRLRTPGVTRLATDEDILKFIEAFVEADPENGEVIKQWLEGAVQGDPSLLAEEKDRMTKLVMGFLSSID